MDGTEGEPARGGGVGVAGDDLGELDDEEDHAAEDLEPHLQRGQSAHEALEEGQAPAHQPADLPWEN